jgi:hypothetical protein
MGALLHRTAAAELSRAIQEGFAWIIPQASAAMVHATMEKRATPARRIAVHARLYAVTRSAILLRGRHAPHAHRIVEFAQAAAMAIVSRLWIRAQSVLLIVELVNQKLLERVMMSHRTSRVFFVP